MENGKDMVSPFVGARAVRKSGTYPCFVPKSLQEKLAPFGVGVENFQSVLLVQMDILDCIHRPHSTGTKRPLNSILAIDDGARRKFVFLSRGHGGSRWRSY